MSSSTHQRDEAPWDAEETARFRQIVVKAAHSRKLKEAENQVKSGVPAAEQLRLTRSVSGKVKEQDAGLILQWLPGYKSWLAFVKRATRKGYDENGKARPRAPGFKGGATPGSDQEQSAVGQWQRTNGPFYVQVTGAATLLVGFLNHIALNNHNGSGIAGLSQSLFAMGILVLMLGFAVERKGTDE